MKEYSIIPVLIEIRPSLILPNEIGLFTARSLKKGTIIGEADKFEERFIPWTEYKKIDSVTKKKVKQYCIQTPTGFYAPQDFNYLTVPWNMNHSCNYNIGFDDKGNFVTVRNVKKGEELTWDYGMGISDPRFKLECKCNAKNCRKIITGNDWKNIEYMKKNEKYFMRELLAN
jgi:SET domain-containing protein